MRLAVMVYDVVMVYVGVVMVYEGGSKVCEGMRVWSQCYLCAQSLSKLLELPWMMELEESAIACWGLQTEGRNKSITSTRHNTSHLHTHREHFTIYNIVYACSYAIVFLTDVLHPGHQAFRD